MNSRISVMVICPYFGAASEVWMYRQLVGLEECDPLVICDERLHELQYPARGIDVRVLPKSGRVEKDMVFTRYVKRLSNIIRNWKYLGFRDHPRIAKFIAAARKERSPQALLFHYGTTFVRFYPFVRTFKLPIAVHYNGYDLSRALKSSRFRAEFARYLPYVTSHIVVAEYMKEALIELGASEDRICMIPYGVPIKDFKVSESLSLAECRFLMAGRLTAKKSPLTTIRAFAQCARENHNCTLEVIGDGDLRSQCEEFVRSEKLEHLVTFSGEKPNSYVREAMSRSSVYLQHSVTAASGDKEGWPVAIAEACASGLPVVSTRHASIPAQVIHGETGYLVEENDSAGMEHYMNKLATSPDLRVRYGKAARLYIEQWDASAQIKKLDRLLAAL